MARTGTDIPGGWGRWGAAGLFLALFQVLLRAENPDLMSDDGGEMIAASWTLGLPHPPGYPLFDLVGHLFSRLPLGSPAFRYNLLSGLFALGAVLLTAGLVLRLARREMGRGEAAWVPPALALASALALFFDGNFFAQALSAKGALYLSMALLAGGLAAGWLAREGKPLGRREQALVLFGWSLGISAHWETAVLFLPFLGLWFWLSRRRWTSKSLLLALTAGLLGLSPYLYLPLRAALHAWPSWGAPVTWTGFRWVVGRGLVSGHESFLHDWASYVGSAQRVGAVLAGGLPGAWVLVLVGWSAAWRQRWGWVGALGVLAAPVVAAVVAVREAQDIHYLLGAYLVSVSVPWVLFAFAGFRSLFDRLGTGGRWMGPALLAVALLALSIWGCRVLYLEGKADYSLADDLGKNALRGIPRGGLLVAGGDHYVMPVLYDQAVLGLRPDVLFVPDVFLAHQWGWEQITERRPDWGEGWKGQVLGRRWEWLVSKARASGGAYYALGPRYLDPVLAQAPGTWIPAGLARRWAKEDRPDEAAPSLAAMDGER
ncbi:MAG TPA: DUF2723 domain-containing protein, partial [bacterium]|nr:DUF2723 domain-containing protein [bacterium]